MELRAGMYCVDAEGKKQGPMYTNWSFAFEYSGSRGTFRLDGTSIHGEDPDLIAEWTEDLPYGHALLPDGSTVDLTAIEKCLGLLDDDVREALKAHGGPYESVSTRGEWVPNDAPTWFLADTYRVSPQPAPTPIDISGIKFADWVNWVAKDKDGNIWGCERRPEKDDSVWGSSGGKIANLDALAIDPGTCDWRNSLQKVKR